MGQNNDPTEGGDAQGQQGAPPKIPAGERKRQSGYAPAPAAQRGPAREDGGKPDSAKG